MRLGYAISALTAFLPHALGAFHIFNRQKFKVGANPKCVDEEDPPWQVGAIASENYHCNYMLKDVYFGPIIPGDLAWGNWTKITNHPEICGSGVVDMTMNPQNSDELSVTESNKANVLAKCYRQKQDPNYFACPDADTEIPDTNCFDSAVVVDVWVCADTQLCPDSKKN